jgi:hypothetical protein
MLKKFLKFSLFFGLLLPKVGYGAFFTKTNSLLGSFLNILDSALPILFSLALLLFFWGVAGYIWSEGNAKEDSKKIMFWGIIALFVMTAVWGLVAVIQQSLLGNNNPQNMKIPSFGNGGSSAGSDNCVDGYNGSGTQDGC